MCAVETGTLKSLNLYKDMAQKASVWSQPLLSHCALRTRPYFWNLCSYLFKINSYNSHKIQNFNNLTIRACTMGIVLNKNLNPPKYLVFFLFPPLRHLSLGESKNCTLKKIRLCCDLPNPPCHTYTR